MIRFTALAFLASFLTTPHACLTEHIARAAQASTANDCVGSPAPVNNKFAIKNAQVFNGNGFQSSETIIIIIIINDARIFTVGGNVPPGINTIDGTGRFLIPGLIDSDVHPSSCSNLVTLSGYGVTTAINMACLNYTACSQLKGQLGTTDYITAGEIACGTGSVHATAFGVPPAETIGPDRDLAAFVDYTFGNGSDFFKIVAEDKGPTVQQQTTMVQLAHQLGSFAATHATMMEYYDQAIQSKADRIQHTPADGLLSKAQISQIRSQGQFVTPTMEFYRLAFANPALGPVLGFNASCNYSNIQTNVANMHVAGVPIAVGTDAVGSFAGVINYPFGRSLHCELQNLVDAGFGNAKAIQAATAGAAKLYRLYDRGSIATGMRADLLLLNSNPVEDITNTLDISAAWVGGIQVSAISAQKGQSCDPASLSP
ncbi:amidohydrolase protein [Penicillium cataractarum]|uniref:Amidohydrolase protein n=1 Tax=Penicillium cataractarum TaxID=2100454 RepID=A0A9W9RPX0_9EURO|nr:amidohydrolase protein [Penicillium cataractarum]KAJ5364246.1 amidohydrolase protein [Penicillium cataractarum]